VSARGLWLILIGLAGVAWAAWQWAYTPDPSSPRPLAPEPWQIQARPLLNHQSALRYLRATDRWGDLARLQVAQVQKEPAWGFNGVVSRGKERYALLVVEGQPERNIAAGDKLPDGSTIVAVGDTTLCILINGKKRELSLFQDARPRPNY
jgi:hypothetical protein